MSEECPKIVFATLFGHFLDVFGTYFGKKFFFFIWTLSHGSLFLGRPMICLLQACCLSVSHFMLVPTPSGYEPANIASGLSGEAIHSNPSLEFSLQAESRDVPLLAWPMLRELWS